jgi:hypothetical protein
MRLPVKPGDRNQVPTVGEIVRDAAALTDPAGHDDGVIAMFEAYEDDGRPATAVEDLGGELGSTAGGIDPEGDSPAVEMTAAAAFWLATNPDQAHDRDRTLREGARLAYGGQMPDRIQAWLAEQGITV